MKKLEWHRGTMGVDPLTLLWKSTMSRSWQKLEYIAIYVLIAFLSCPLNHIPLVEIRSVPSNDSSEHIAQDLIIKINCSAVL